jgi:hypothetical protein
MVRGIEGPPVLPYSLKVRGTFELGIPSLDIIWRIMN